MKITFHLITNKNLFDAEVIHHQQLQFNEFKYLKSFYLIFIKLMLLLDKPENDLLGT